MTAYAPAITADGKTIRLTARVETREQLMEAADSGAGGIGLLNVNSFFDTAPELPSGEEQYKTYCDMVKIMGRKQVTLMASGWDSRFNAAKHNPGQIPGCRGIRQGLANPEALRTQLRALMMAGVQGKFSLVLPMVGHVTELIRVKEQIKDIHKELESGGIPCGLPEEIGIMADMPAVLQAMDIFCFESKFFVVGEDLLYYLYGGDPESKTSGSILRYFDSAYLSYLQELVTRAHRRHKSVAVSSRMTDEPAAILLLLGIGFDEMVLAPGKIAIAREQISRLDAHGAKLLASKAISYWEPEKSLKYCRDAWRKFQNIN